MPIKPEKGFQMALSSSSQDATKGRLGSKHARLLLGRLTIQAPSCLPEVGIPSPRDLYIFANNKGKMDPDILIGSPKV